MSRERRCCTSQCTLPENGFGRCGGVCDEMPVRQGFFLNQQVNTSARVETEACVFFAVCTWIRDGTLSVTF